MAESDEGGAEAAREPGIRRRRRSRPADAPAGAVVPLDEGDLRAPVDLDRAPRGRRALLHAVGRRAAVGAVALLVLLAGASVAAAVLKVRSDAAAAEREAAGYSAPEIAAAGDSIPQVSVIGDGTLVDAAAGVDGGDRWTALVADELLVRIRSIGAVGTGYLTEGDDQRTFEQMTADLPANAQVVVFFGGVADAGSSTVQVSQAAGTAIASAREAVPDADIVIVGPVVADGAATEDVTALRAGLRAAAAVADVRFVDPIRAEWLATADVEGVGADELDMNQQRSVADRMDALLPTIIG